MSIGGPCLWIPPLSSPVPSSLSAVTSHFSGVRHADQSSSVSKAFSPPFGLQRRREPGASLILATDMRPAGQKTGNALTPSPVPGRTSRADPYSGGEIPSLESMAPRSVTEADENLPRVKLEIPGGNDAGLSMPRPQVGSNYLDEGMDTSQEDFDANDERYQESTVSPLDEKSEVTGGEESHKSPTLEMKKKMKRFRLTHNQTRYLMSEFTRQAHPDAAHRQRLSREIPGLTPRQVQVWFQNRRAKLKRLTTNDRERVLKSRALPDDFDTTKVLRTPFEGRSTSQNHIASSHYYGLSNPEFAALRGLRTDGFHRPNDDDYLISPLSSAPNAATYMSSAGQGQNDGSSHTGAVFGRPAASASMSDLQRTIRSDYSITRSNSLSASTSQPPSFHSGNSAQNRFAPPSHMPYARQPMDYDARTGAMITPYDQHPSFEGSISPETHESSMPYNLSHVGSQSQGYQPHLAMSTSKDFHGLGIGTRVPTHTRPISTMQALPVSGASDYRPYSYTSTSGPMDTISYTQASTSNVNMPTSYASSDSGSTAHDSMQPPSHGLDSLRSKFGNTSFNYANYMPQ